MGAAVASFLLMALAWYAFLSQVTSQDASRRSTRHSLILIALGLVGPTLTAGLYLTPLGPYAPTVTLAAAGVAIAAHALVQRDPPPLSLARRRSLGYALFTLASALLYAALNYGTYQLARLPGAGLVLASGLALAGMVLAFPGLGEALVLWTERTLLHSGYAAQRMLEEVAVAAPALLDLEPLAAMILERTLETLSIRWGIFALWDRSAQELQAVVARGLPHEAGHARWGHTHPLSRWLLSGQEDNRAKKLPDTQPPGSLPPLDTAWIVPVRLREETVGVFLYGPHTTGEPYSATERSVLDLLAHETAAAVANARLFDQVARARREWLETFDALSDGVFLHDRQGTILRANRALAKLVGRSFDQIIARPWFEVMPAGAEARALCQAPPSGGPSQGAVEYDLSYGGQRTLHVTVSRPADGDDFCVHVVRDVTQARALQLQLAQAEKLAAIGELLSGVAHELNNPLTTIIGFSELLLEEPDVPEPVRVDLQRISRQAKRSSRIVQSLLTFARQSRIQLAEVDVNALLAQTLELVQGKLEGSGLRVTLDLDPHLPHTLADAGQLQQVFLNLFTNAQQAMAGSQGPHDLCIQTQATLTDLRIRISDRGPGIPQELLQRVFDPFFTTKRVGEGTGLGLSICYGIVREHGGRIWAESEPHHGATFYIELPVRHAAAATPDGPLPADQPRRRILVVEDEEPVANLLTRVLGAAGYQVISATDGEEGLSLLAQAIAHGQPPDLIVADLKMPRLDGPGLYERVRRRYPHLSRRFLFVSGDVIRPQSLTFLEGTDLPYLRKPFGVREAREAVARALAHADT